MLLALAGALVVAAAAGAKVSDGHARVAARGDSGAFWDAVVRRTLLALGVPAFVSAFAPALDGWWSTGYHAQYDRVLGAVWAAPSALVLPFVAWAVVLGVTSGAPATPRRLAGSIGRVRRRQWLVHFAWLPALAVVGGWRELGVGADGYPAFVWGTMATVAVSVACLAWSAGATSVAAPVTVAAAAVAPVPALPPWPEALEARGVSVRPVATWQPHGDARPVPATAQAFASALDAAGVQGVATEVVEAVDTVLRSQDRAPAAVLLAPDDCGQAEALAVAATAVYERHNQATLVITPRRDAVLESALCRWVPAATAVHVLSAGDDRPADALLWVVDAQTLSDTFLERLTEESFVARIGLVVWWDVHVYTGVLAANVWAISRRLVRLLAARDASRARTLVLARDAGDGHARLDMYVRRLFPYDVPRERRFRVERTAARTVTAYMLGAQDRFFASPNPLPPRARHPGLVATLVSATAGWPTVFHVPEDVTDAERDIAFALQVAGTQLRARVAASDADAGASVRTITAADMLALEAVVGHAGRNSPAGLVHHVGIAVPPNPYLTWLMDRRGNRPIPMSRRLVGPEARPAIVERHLLAALREREDTRSELVATFLWNEAVIQRKLDELDQREVLAREEVRFLTPEGERRIDYLYRSLMRPVATGPLDTVGLDLIAVREPATADRDGGVRMEVDPQRREIQAYPGRVFVRGGERFRVRDWTETTLRTQGWIECGLEEPYALTWRMRTPLVRRISRTIGSDPVVVHNGGGVLVKRLALDVEYQEEIHGVVRLERDGESGRISVDQSQLQRPRLLTPFPTRALGLLVLPAPTADTLASLALALRCVLPVLVGVEEDALEVVSLVGRHIDPDMNVFGLAIVDLYPGGIGLIDALQDDEVFISSVLEATRDWLAAMAAEPAGAAALRTSPQALATPSGHDLGAATSLLTRLLGDPPPRSAPARRRAGA